MNPLSKFLKGPVIVETTGPSSYSSGGFTVSVGKLRIVKHANVELSGGYVGEVASISGNTLTIKAYYFDYDASADGAAVEVADGTDLSSVTVKVIAWGV